MVETKTIDGRKQFYVDVGDMKSEQIIEYLKEIKEQFGKSNFSEIKEK